MEPSLRKAFYDDVYSNHFNILRFLGQWDSETEDPKKKKLNLLRRLVSAVFGLTLTVAGLMDLYLCRLDFKKIVFNVCTTMLITGIFVKNLHIQRHCKELNQLRMNLFKDGWKQRENPEDVEIKEIFTKVLLLHKKIFYFASFSLLPLWLITSLTTLFWGPRQLPFSVYTPVDLDDNFQFFLGFLFQVAGSAYIVAETIQADLAMFSILLQIATQYCILAKNIRKIEEIYGEDSLGNEATKIDINKTLLHHKTKERLRECVQKQLTLMRYVKNLESVYNKPMMIQLIAGFVLSIGNGLELIVVSMNFSVKLSYQVGYSVIVLGDVFMCCNLADLLLTQGREVVWSLYDVPWYKMDSEIRKHITLIMIGAQKIQPLTAAKMFSLNLTTFLGLLKNVYSWLALFRQLVIKK